MTEYRVWYAFNVIVEMNSIVDMLRKLNGTSLVNMKIHLKCYFGTANHFQHNETLNIEKKPYGIMCTKRDWRVPSPFDPRRGHAYTGVILKCYFQSASKRSYRMYVPTYLYYYSNKYYSWKACTGPASGACPAVATRWWW
jgi:hypothetical protein